MESEMLLLKVAFVQLNKIFAALDNDKVLNFF